jgi:hypothetical protein
MLVATLGLVSCGGGNETASTGTPVVAQATVFDPTANGGCGKSSSYGGTGPVLNAGQQQACGEAFGEAFTDEYNASQCSALGGNLWWEICTVASWSPTANGGCAKSSSFGGSGPALNAGGLGFAEKRACGEALASAGGTSQCSALGGNWVNQRGSAGGSWSYCDGGAAGLKGRGFGIN